jgi:hypothetical protein
MQVLGLGWKQFAIKWLHKDMKRSVDKLAMHLKIIIREEQKLVPQTDPALEMPKCVELPILGTATQQLLESNDTAKNNEKEFRVSMAEVQKQREVKGEGSIISVMQPFYCLELDELIDRRIDVLYSFQLSSGKKALRWCQGKVIKIYIEKTKPTVVVGWDLMPNVKGKENSIEETQQELPQRKWNKDVEGAWRMNNNVGFIEDSNIEKSETTNIDVRIESGAESSDSVGRSRIIGA